MRLQLSAATILAAGFAALGASPAPADQPSVCETIGGEWSPKSNIVHTTGRPACELVPNTPGASLLKLQVEVPADVAADPAASQQLTTWITNRVKHYQQASTSSADGASDIAVGVTFEEQQISPTDRSLVFTEVAFTKGVTSPSTQTFPVAFHLSAAPEPSQAPATSTPTDSTPTDSTPTSTPPVSAPSTSTPPARTPPTHVPPGHVPKTRVPTTSTPVPQ